MCSQHFVYDGHLDFFGFKHHRSDYEYQALSEYNTTPEYTGM